MLGLTVPRALATGADWPVRRGLPDWQEGCQLLVWLGLCAAIYLLFTIGAVPWPDLLQDGEGGLLERLQVVVLIVCVVLAWVVRARTAPGPLRIFLTAALVALLLLTGEEISWGQSYLEWPSPPWFRHYNGQGETNLHNTAWELNALPRNVLRIAIVLGGVLYPPVRRFLKQEPRGIPGWLPPTLGAFPSAVFMAVTILAERVPAMDFLGTDITYFELSEVEELFMYLFFACYLAGLSQTITRLRRAGR